MNQKYEKYLPLGSVVILKGAKKRVMIVGYLGMDIEKKDRMYDYTGCPYPEGVIDTKKWLLFNHDSIERIYCIGYSDDEHKDFIKTIKEKVTPEFVEKILAEPKSVDNN